MVVEHCYHDLIVFKEILIHNSFFEEGRRSRNLCLKDVVRFKISLFIEKARGQIAFPCLKIIIFLA